MADPAPPVTATASPTDMVAVASGNPMADADAPRSGDVIASTLAPAAVGGTLAAPVHEAVSETAAAPALAASGEHLAGPGIDPGVETAPTGPAPAGETNPAQAPSAAAPVPPAIRAPLALGTTVMETQMQQANKAAETMMKAAEEAVEFGRGNVEAMTKATQIYVAGVQDLGKQTFAVVQGLADHAMEGAKALSGVKSLQEAMQIQSNFARAAIERSVSESAKLGETALKLTEQTFAPITARMTLAAEKITKVPAAA